MRLRLVCLLYTSRASPEIIGIVESVLDKKLSAVTSVDVMEMDPNHSTLLRDSRTIRRKDLDYTPYIE